MGESRRKRQRETPLAFNLDRAALWGGNIYAIKGWRTFGASDYYVERIHALRLSQSGHFRADGTRIGSIIGAGGWADG